MACCRLCGKFHYWTTPDECPECEKLWQRDLQEGRLPPPLTDPKDLTYNLWLDIRCMERVLAMRGKSPEEIRQAVYKKTETRVKELEYGRQRAVAQAKEHEDYMRNIRDHYSY